MKILNKVTLNIHNPNLKPTNLSGNISDMPISGRIYIYVTHLINNCLSIEEAMNFMIIHRRWGGAKVVNYDGYPAIVLRMPSLIIIIWFFTTIAEA
jgi:hypothetical protein